MTARNPYACARTYEISYAGFDAEHYCFKVALQGKGLDPVMSEMELSQWLFDETQGEWFMGNDWPYPEHPKFGVKLDGRETLIAFRHLVDVALFERDFTVVGLTPTMLA